MKSDEATPVHLKRPVRCSDSKARTPRACERGPSSDSRRGQRGTERRSVEPSSAIQRVGSSRWDEATIDTPLWDCPPRAADRVDYRSMTVPQSYRCGTCEAMGVKLWRTSRTDKPALLCATCACTEQGRGPVTELPDGRVAVGKHGGAEIGWRVPAIPRDDAAGWHEYATAPSQAKDWWLLLTLTAECTDARIWSDVDTLEMMPGDY